MSISFFLPPPGVLILPDSITSGFSSSSLHPLEIVSLDTPVSLDTFSIPPHPITLASAARNNRLAFSLKVRV